MIMKLSIIIKIAIIFMLSYCEIFSQQSYRNLIVGETYLTGEAGTALYSKPNGDKITLVPRLSQVTILEKWGEGHYLVEYNNLRGYIVDIAFGIKPNSISITGQVKEYVEKEINKWQKKGEFEKTADFIKRVNENTRAAKVKQLTEIAINDIKIKYISSFKANSKSIFLGTYDADNETFLIRTPELGQFGIKIPIDLAQSFKSNWQYVDFKNIELNLKDDKFNIAKLEIYNSMMKKSFYYNSNEPITYSLNNVSYSFDPIEIEIPVQENDNMTAIKNNEIRIGKSDIDIDLPISTKENTTFFGVVIGNEHYKNEIEAKFAINDAKSFYEYFNKVLGIPRNNLHLIEDASYGQMQSEFEWLRNISSAFNGNSRLFFYYAGHGIPDIKTRGAYLLPIDGNSILSHTAIKVEDIYNKLTEYETKSVTVFLDACFSGASRSGILAEGRGVRIAPRDEILKGNIVVFSAASKDETAFPYDEKQHGLFTYFILKKIKDSKADVSYFELAEFIKTNVNQLSIVINQKSQTPQVNVSPEFQEAWESLKLK